MDQNAHLTKVVELNFKVSNYITTGNKNEVLWIKEQTKVEDILTPVTEKVNFDNYIFCQIVKYNIKATMG